MKTLESKVTDVIETIQEQIIMAGGKFFKQKEVRNMNVESLLVHLLPNHITFTVKFEKPSEVEQEKDFKE